jgi:large subunit ribosomal protein L35
MPKQKTRKGLAKRVRVTRRGKVVRNKAGRRHLLSGKSRKRKRQLRRKTTLTGADRARVKRALGK